MNKSLLICSIVLAGLSASACADKVEIVERQTCVHNNKTYECDIDQLCCEGVCVDQSETNCGACASPCSVNEVCELQNADTAQLTKKYVYECICKADKRKCSGECCEDGCKDIINDSNNCGACGTICAANTSCTRSECEPNCATPLMACTDETGKVTCESTLTDPANCGGCGIKCPDDSNVDWHLKGSYCSGGQCQIVCEEGYEDADRNIENGCESQLSSCGNGILEPGELCDGPYFGANKTCEDFNGIGSTGTPKCNNTCSGIESGSCSVPSTNPDLCGNGVLDQGEQCDPKRGNLPTCAEALNVPTAKGNVVCTDACQFDIRGCYYCGNGVLDADEACDKTSFKNSVKSCREFDSKYISGELSCTNSCEIDASACIEKCNDGSRKCSLDKKSIESCIDGVFQSTPCASSTPFCEDSPSPTCVQCITDSDCIPSGSTFKCVERACKDTTPAQTTTGTDFDWMNNDNNNEAQSYTIKYTTIDGAITYTVTARINAAISTSVDCTISNVTPVLKNTSSIVISGITGGVGTLTFDYRLYDANASLKINNIDVSDLKGDKCANVNNASVAVNDATATTITIMSTARIAIDNLYWTSMP